MEECNDTNVFLSCLSGVWAAWTMLVWVPNRTLGIILAVIMLIMYDVIPVILGLINFISFIYECVRESKERM